MIQPIMPIIAENKNTGLLPNFIAAAHTKGLCVRQFWLLEEITQQRQLLATNNLLQV